MSNNIVYRGDDIAQYYSRHRGNWDGFYKSEQWIFERVVHAGSGSFGHVLDVGCAAGGLGLALAERAHVSSYTGVDVNRPAIDAARARSYPIPSMFHAADILDCPELGDKVFDTVFSLSAADWNVETDAVIAEGWRRVKPGGCLVISLRLTPGEGVKDIERSYQYICFEGTPTASTEIAPYVVFNTSEALSLFAHQEPAPVDVLGYGYWGAPSAMARTCFERLVFAVFAVRKPGDATTRSGDAAATATLHLPLDAYGVG